MARTQEVAVISVDYRRAPEAVCPAALDDCVLAAEHARQEFDKWCAVAGDSAGGNLALAVSLTARPGREYDAQLLVYPCLDATMAGTSYETFADGYGLTRDAMALYWKTCSGRHPSTDPLLSPHNAEWVGGLPPTLLASAGYDVLYDEDRRFAERLVSAGVCLTYLPFMSLPHGFIDPVDRVDSARDAVRHMLTSFKSFVPSRA